MLKIYVIEGKQGSGKTTTAKDFLEGKGYVEINGAGREPLAFDDMQNFNNFIIDDVPFDRSRELVNVCNFFDSLQPRIIIVCTQVAGLASYISEHLGGYLVTEIRVDQIRIMTPDKSALLPWDGEWKD